tara:strand:- start:508 stop:702 length:195 start_codon:yes stop_codon:yes gene_type:complete
LNIDSDESFLLYLAIKLKTMIWRKNNEKKKKKNDSCCCERHAERRRRRREEGRASSFHFSLLIK